MIKVETEGRLRVLRLARAEKVNALTAEMLERVRYEIAAATAEDIAVLVLTGEGRVFSAGADLAGMKAGLGNNPLWEQVSAGVAAFPGLTIAALNGTLAGGAMGMALACDIRIAVPEAEFFYPVMRLGYLPQPSDPARLAALIGPARARMILLAGQRISVAEALTWGLIDRIVAPDAVLDTARALAVDALGADRAHLRALKRMVG
jgi:enoyl-CoA hydratase